VEQKDPKQKKPGLPEAIHPEIGNGALWESDPHFANLRFVDPSNSLDHYLLDETEREAIIKSWNSSFDLTSNENEESQSNIPDSGFEPIPTQEKSKGKEKKILASARDKGQKPDWFEAMEGDLILQEDPNRPEEIQNIHHPAPDEAPVPEGKRVRKAAKKALKEQKIKKIESLHPPARPEEASLSPFTRWLKNLKGSEYVHPYEDDYALEQMSGPRSEGISETFADLLARQGYKDQALDMYKLLMAKYPEKSSFFAAKIEALK